MCISIASDPEEVEDRVIDRSGDIDQRPPEERHLPPSNILLFQGAPDKGPLQHPPIARSLSAIPEEPRRANYVKGNELGEMAKRLQKELDKRGTKAKAQLDALTQKIEAQEKRCLAPKLDDELQQIRLKRQKVLIMNGPTLANCLRDERSRLADLEQFKSRNRLLREPHYPESPTLAIGILMMLILAEAGLNGVLFAETSDQGLFGGWLEALVLAVTNVGVAFLFGRIALPQLHRRGFFLSTAAAATSLAGFASLIAINLFAAHYRDFKVEFAKHELSVLSQPLAKKEPTVLTSSQKPGYPGKIAAAPKPDLAAANAADRGEPRWRGAEAEAIRRAISAPVDLKSFTSFFLLITGLCGAAIAALDGYKFDDPYPGYGKLHRRYLQTRERSTAVLRSILAQSNAIMEGNFLAIARKIDNHAHELAKLVSLHHS
ncbi:MAG TPA: hypothetical protein VE986_03745, partial [Hyphomicrobiales bacterium]|nr:hypothetical protein [Hyphomicrobiales bacterium]